MATMTLSSTLQEATSLLATVEVDLQGAQETQQQQVRLPVGEGPRGQSRGCSSLPAGGIHQERGAFHLQTCPRYHRT